MELLSTNTLDTDSIKIIEASHHDPFSILSRHQHGKLFKVKIFLPYAESVCFANGGPEISRLTGTDFFEYSAQPNELPEHYQLSWVDKEGGQTHRLRSLRFRCPITGI